MQRATIILALAAGLAGCAPRVTDPLARQDPSLRWPRPPEQPRVVYLGELRGSTDFPARPNVLRELFIGPESDTLMATPHDVAVDGAGQRVAVADPNGPCVHLFDLDERRYTRLTGTEDEEATATTALVAPVAVAWAGQALFIADAKAARIARWRDGPGLDWLDGPPLTRPAGLAADPARGWLHVVDAGRHAIVSMTLDGRVLRTFATHGGGKGQLNFPTHLALSPDGDLIVSDSLNFRVQRFSAYGEWRETFGSKGDASGDFALPKGVTVDGDGNLWVVDAHFENVQAFTPDGRLLMAFGGEGTAPGKFSLPAGACVDVQNRLWIADSYNRRVQVFQLAL